MSNSSFSDLKDPKYALEYIASSLHDGTLVLFLGSGASKGFGLPDWIDLINDLRKDVGLDKLKNTSSAEDLQVGADQVREKVNNSDEKFIELIAKHLYQKIGDLQSISVFDNHLLISISALLMGSKRGRVNRVVTLNFDSMLEWYLSLFGFVVKTVYELPDLEGSEDVRIYHPHGFVPHPDLNLLGSDFVILGMDAVNERLGTPGDLWFEKTRHILDSGVCLFIGMSSKTLNDRALAPLLKTSGKKHFDKRPLGFWILKESLNMSKNTMFDNNNIIPISITDEKKISEFVLKICQKSREVII